MQIDEIYTGNSLIQSGTETNAEIWKIKHTLAHELILQWKIDKLQPESPLARIVSSVERFTASISELLDCKQNYLHHR